MPANDDYAIIAGPPVASSLIIQLHADSTYHANPLPSLLPEAGARHNRWMAYLAGASQQAARAGLRETFLHDLEGCCWVPGVVIALLNGDNFLSFAAFFGIIMFT